MDGNPNQETGFNSPRRCLTSRGRQDIVYPPSPQHLDISMLHDRHEIRPPERNLAVTIGAPGSTFDFPSLSSEFVSTDFISLAVQPSIQDQQVRQSAIKSNHGDAEDRRYRHCNDSSPHLDDQHGNPTVYATSTTDFQRQQIYCRPKRYSYPEMADYITRRQTYKNWPLNHGPSVEDLINANMFYEGNFSICYYFIFNYF